MKEILDALRNNKISAIKASMMLCNHGYTTAQAQNTTMRILYRHYSSSWRLAYIGK